jgi:hypothetical protein
VVRWPRPAPAFTAPTPIKHPACCEPTATTQRRVFCSTHPITQWPLGLTQGPLPPSTHEDHTQDQLTRGLLAHGGCQQPPRAAPATAAPAHLGGNGPQMLQRGAPPPPPPPAAAYRGLVNCCYVFDHAPPPLPPLSTQRPQGIECCACAAACHEHPPTRPPLMLLLLLLLLLWVGVTRPRSLIACALGSCSVWRDCPRRELRCPPGMVCGWCCWYKGPSGLSPGLVYTPRPLSSSTLLHAQ